MILLLIHYLNDSLGIKVPAAFHYYSTRMMLAALTSLLLSIFLGPFFIRKLYELKIGQSIRKEDCPLLGKLHEKKQNTPTMGGILILFSMLVSLFLWMDLTHVFTLILFVTTLYLGYIGGKDDYLKLKYKNTKGMSAKGKLFFQFILSLFIAGYFFWSPLSQAIAHGDWFQLPVIKERVLAKDVASQSLPARTLAQGTSTSNNIHASPAQNSSQTSNPMSFTTQSISLRDYASDSIFLFLKNRSF